MSVDQHLYLCRWNPSVSSKQWRRRGGLTVNVGDGITPDPPVEPQVGRFPGHVPNRVLIGMATPEDGAPVGPAWTQARAIIDHPIYEARRFKGGWITSGNFNEMVSQADAAAALPWISFKVPSNNWAGVYNGTYNADLVTLFNLAQAYGDPVLCTFHHEPAGDGDLATWARMQTYCSYFFAGYRNVSVSSGGVVTLGTYNSSHDLSINNGGNFGWWPVGNGFWWRNMTNSGLAADRAAAWPQHLIDAINANGGGCGNDFYDTDYSNQTLALTDPAYRTVGTGVRTSTRLANFMEWAREKEILSSGAGEFGCIDGADIISCWEVMRANRDIWSIGNYFNSAVNSDHDWRLVPADYPAPSPPYTSSKGFVVYGGNAQSAGRLAAFQDIVAESILPEYTSPL